MNKVIGLDLGTSVCRSAIYRNGKVDIIPNRYSGGGMPLIVEHSKNTKEGLDKKGIYLPFIFSSINRKIGFEGVIQLENKDLSVVALTSDIFQELKEDAKEYINGEICGAVVTVPSCFSEKQRAFLKASIERGGFAMVRLLDENMAAIIGSELHEEGKIIMVYTLGGGAFSVSLFRIVHGFPQVLWQEGDRSIGGNDFDALIVGYILNKLGINVTDVQQNTNFILKLKHLAEKIKIDLSETPFVDFDVNLIDSSSMSFKSNMSNSVKLSLTRQEFEEMLHPFIDRTIILANTVTKEAGCTKNDINSIMLMGGSCKIPLIGKRMREEFGNEVTQISDMLCVKGAAMYASQLSVPAEEKNIDQQHKTAESIPLEVDIGILKKNDCKQSSGREWLELFSHYLIEAQSLWQSGNRDKSMERLEELHKELPKFIADLYRKTGEIYLNENKIYLAFSSLEKAFAYNNNDDRTREAYHKACSLKGKMLCERGEYKDAWLVIKSGLKYKPECDGCKKYIKQIEDAIRRKKFPRSPHFNQF